MNDPIAEVNEWLDQNSTVVSPIQARHNAHPLKKNIHFKLESGNSVHPKFIMYKNDIRSEAQKISINVLLIANNKPKMKLPLFSCCIDGKVNACVLDIENSTNITELEYALQEYEYIAYFSASSDILKQRLRVIIPLTEEVPYDEYDYCKSRLQNAFDLVTDIHSFESKRFFFLPSLKVGEWDDPNEIIHHSGRSLDFYKTTKFNMLDRQDMKEKKNATFKTEAKNVEDDERVQYYLNTDFPLIFGNGDSASSLYTAIVVCLANEDEDTLQLVLDKARSEQWTEKELKRKIDDASKFLNRRG